MPPSEIEWLQAIRHPMSKQRDPVQGEFFNTESITTLAAKLTREGIGQNPMDASISLPVHVRVYVSGLTGALGAADAAAYFKGLREHVAACDADAALQFDHECRFIVVEDFNTIGLQGDPTATEEPPEGTPNHFFYFYRAEGKSGKSGPDRGRWGVGKYVFPMASHINTFFGLTVRQPTGETAEPEAPLLMGQAVLKNHQLPDGVSYEPDGWWADLNNDVPVPIRDPEVIDTFRTRWNVKREMESGLSIIIPYVREDLTAKDLTKAIVHDYYLAVLSGRFSVEIDSAELESPMPITTETLEAVVSMLDDTVERDELGHRISLARWYTARSENEFVHVAQPTSAPPKWDSDLLAQEERSRIQHALDSGEAVAIRVPVHVAAQGQSDGTWSFFDVVLAPEPGHGGKPQFVREGLFVPEVNSPRLAGVRCFVIVDDRDLAQMVGDAEGPAHANWSAQTQKFSGKYRYGKQWLSFIKRAPAEILRIVRAEDEEADPKLLSRYFPMPATEAAPPLPTGPDIAPGPGPTPPPPPPPPPGQPRRVRVDRITGGFSVNLTGNGPVGRIHIKAAYDRRGGDPFKRWRVEDFDLADSSFDITVQGGLIERQVGNVLVVGVYDPDAFSLHVRGFDVNRDLRVNTKSEAVA